MIYTITLNPAIDQLLFVKNDIEKRQANRIIRSEWDCGGKGLHVSGVLSKFSIKNEALGIVGSQNRAALYSILSEKQIAHDFLVQDGARTRTSFVIISEESSGSIMMPEAGFPTSEANKIALLEQIRQKVTQEDIVVIAGSPPPNFTLADFGTLLKAVKATGCFVACDVSGAYLHVAVKLGVDFIKPNEHEIEEILVDKTKTLVENINLLAKNIRYLIVSLSGEGSYCAHQGRVYRIIAPQVLEKNDTGAGDCFVGAFIAGISDQLPLQEILKRATGCSASKVMHADSSTFSMVEAEILKEQVTIIEVEEM
ncbi:1-phosphofructokinase family hexose kinase [Listeria weihenstephanensis]|uniref:Tagatose-6-phosphate kinase n=1 Tax=Listeria weihenstephanensis TaxID=1006155 RepID=A0A841ZBA4_9LIST|nr:1-phosphofructokinase family hexose kinase [Listeria weihenstephanensis]MBC1501767.1 1-phosphofructokinase family hexose kinase [Listeria weihenstephanensis]